MHMLLLLRYEAIILEVQLSQAMPFLIEQVARRRPGIPTIIPAYRQR